MIANTDRNIKKGRIRTFDMFCGGGGSSFGAAMADAEIVGGIDLWPLATKVFADNFPRARLFEGRVEKIDPHAIVERTGQIDLLLASPECTNHSCARGGRPKVKASQDTAFHVIRYAQAMRPRWIVIENVISMRGWARYPEFLKSLGKEGYAVEEYILDAADYGVPQKRRRLFIICDREADLPSRIPKKAGPKRSAARIIDRPGTWANSPLDNGKRAAATLERANRGFSTLGWDEPFLIVYYGNDGAGGWQPLNVPLRTITTLDRFGLCEPSENGPMLRMLQVPELARGMGFDDALLLNRGTRRDRVKIVGNGVCPPVMKSIIRTLNGRES